jgi:hypothetical protein
MVAKRIVVALTLAFLASFVVRSAQSTLPQLKGVPELAASTLSNRESAPSFLTEVQTSNCVQQPAPSVDCKCGADGHIMKATCYITVDPVTSKKCGGPYCEACTVVCARK